MSARCCCLDRTSELERQVLALEARCALVVEHGQAFCLECNASTETSSDLTGSVFIRRQGSCCGTWRQVAASGWYRAVTRFSLPAARCRGRVLL
eukprot:766695-Hanusia_phi.AAC.1